MEFIHLLVIAGVLILAGQAETNRRSHMAQVDDLRAAIAQVATDLQEATDRVLAKIAELGEPDADLSAEISNLGDISTRLDGLVAGEIPPPAPPQDELPVEGQ